MKYLDDLVSFLISNTVNNQKREQEEKEDRGVVLSQFRFPKIAKELISPSEKCAKHHREREQHYIKELEFAERELREKGVSVEVFDQSSQTYMNSPGNFVNICSGAIQNQSAVFQPRVDQKLLDNVKNAKSKMLDHRSKAEQYEKYARAFKCCPADMKVDLGIEDVHYFRLEE